MLDKLGKLFGITHIDYYAPSLHLGNENYHNCKSSSTVATERYKRSVKRKVLADIYSVSIKCAVEKENPW